MCVTAGGRVVEECMPDQLRIYTSETRLESFDIVHPNAAIYQVEEINRKITQTYSASMEEFCEQACSPEVKEKVRQHIRASTLFGEFKEKPIRTIVIHVAGSILGIGAGAGGFVLLNFAFGGNNGSIKAMAGIGAGIGAVSVCLFQGLSACCKVVRKASGMDPSPEYLQWKRREVKERYDLLSNALRNTLGEERLKTELGVDFLPRIPVSRQFVRNYIAHDFGEHITYDTVTLDKWNEPFQPSSTLPGYPAEKEQDWPYDVKFAENTIKNLWPLVNKYASSLPGSALNRGGPIVAPVTWKRGN